MSVVAARAGTSKRRTAQPSASSRTLISNAQLNRRGSKITYRIILTLVVVPAVYTLVDDLQRIVISLPVQVRGLLRRLASSISPSPRRRPLTVATAPD